MFVMPPFLGHLCEDNEWKLQIIILEFFNGLSKIAPSYPKIELDLDIVMINLYTKLELVCK